MRGTAVTTPGKQPGTPGTYKNTIRQASDRHKNKIRHARHNAASDRHQIRHTRQNAGSDMHQIARHACQAKRPCRQGDWRQHRSTLYSVEIHDVAIHTVAVLAQAEFDLATGISH